jgi:hypothetical protein
MCTDERELQEKANWDGTGGASRRQLIDNLHSMLFLFH